MVVIESEDLNSSSCFLMMTLWLWVSNSHTNFILSSHKEGIKVLARVATKIRRDKSEDCYFFNKCPLDDRHCAESLINGMIER